jgi:CRP-like cAMP-binding protein
MPTEMMIRRLRVYSTLSDEDANALRILPAVVKEFPAEHVFVREGQKPTHCCVVMSGFAFRSKVSSEGRRQILSFHPAGDMPDLHGLCLRTMDHDLATLSPATIAFIEHRFVNDLVVARPEVGRALWRETVVDAAVFRQWIVNLGVKSAQARFAHLLAELRQRLGAVGLAAEDQFNFPVTQSELAEALGISDVHVNRVLKSFRERGILDFQRGKITFNNVDQILAIGGFDDVYLQEK